MSTTLAYLRGRRAWLIEGVKVWGTESEAEVYMATLEMVGSDNRVGLWVIALGGEHQEMAFADLVDVRGNNLPAQIKKPVVVIIQRQNKSAYIKAISGEAGFVIAKSDLDLPAVLVDLLIFETGL